MSNGYAAILVAAFVVFPALGFSGGAAKTEAPPAGETSDVVAPGWTGLVFDRPIRISVSSPEGRPYGGTTLHSIHATQAVFRLDHQARLIGVLSTVRTPIAPGYRSRGEVHVAVFDSARRLLGTAKRSYEGGGYWSVKPIIETGIGDLELDFGISSTYKDAKFFAVAITENPETPKEQHQRQ